MDAKEIIIVQATLGIWLGNYEDNWSWIQEEEYLEDLLRGPYQ
jgi:hypothetical protein